MFPGGQDQQPAQNPSPAQEEISPALSQAGLTEWVLRLCIPLGYDPSCGQPLSQALPSAERQPQPQQTSHLSSTQEKEGKVWVWPQEQHSHCYTRRPHLGWTPTESGIFSARTSLRTHGVLGAGYGREVDQLDALEQPCPGRGGGLSAQPGGQEEEDIPGGTEMLRRPGVASSRRALL